MPRDIPVGNGKLLVMVNPFQNDALKKWLAKYGFELGDNLVVEPNPIGRLFGIGPEVPIVQQYESHAITRDMNGVTTLFPLTRSVGTAKTPPQGIILQTLAQTSAQSWGETNREALQRGEAKPDPEDARGPLPVAAVATKDKAVQYESIQTLGDLKDAIASNLSVVFGFTVYESFESQAVAQTGVMPMPKKSEAVVGGHAVLAVGYSDAKGHVIVRNSWGASWGDHGYFYMPYQYLTGSKASSDATPVSNANGSFIPNSKKTRGTHGTTAKLRRNSRGLDAVSLVNTRHPLTGRRRGKPSPSSI